FYGRSEAEAQAKANKARRERRIALGGSPTVRDWMAQWLRRKQSTLRPQTWMAYEMHARLHIVPMLGDIRLDALRPEDIEKWHAHLFREVGSTTSKHIDATLRTALYGRRDSAERWGILVS